MIYSYNINEQALGTDADVIYNNNVVNNDSAIIHTPGTSIFTLVRPGSYRVTVTATGAASASGTDPITLALYNGSVQIPGAISSVTSADTTDIGTLVIDAIITVRPSCCAINNTVNLTVKNIGVAATYSNTTIAIAR